MARGHSEFKPMEMVKTEETSNANVIKENLKHKDPDINKRGTTELDPMKEFKVNEKGLVHHMEIPSHISDMTMKAINPEKAAQAAGKLKKNSDFLKEKAEIGEMMGRAYPKKMGPYIDKVKPKYDKALDKMEGAVEQHKKQGHLFEDKDFNPNDINAGQPPDPRIKKGFVKDTIEEARASIKGVTNMRGSAKYPVMKGFEDVTIKGGTSAECMPPDPGNDALDDEKLKKYLDKKKGGSTKTEEEDLTFSKDLNLVGGKANRDIKDGYVSDIQGAKVSSAKGYDRYNAMVEKGMAVDVSINPYNVGESIDALNAHSGMVAKEIGDNITVKAGMADVTGRVARRSGVMQRAGRAIEEGVGKVTGAVGGKIPGVKRAEEALRSGTTLGDVGSTKNRIRRGAADILHDKKKVGAAAIGAGAIGTGVGVKKLAEEEKGFGSKKKLTNSLETKGALARAGKYIDTGAKKAGEYIKEGAKKVGHEMTKTPARAIATGAGAYTAGVGGLIAGGGATGGAIGGGKGKRGAGAKEGVKANFRALAHPFEAADPKQAEKFNPYLAGRKLRGEEKCGPGMKTKQGLDSEE
jgi:hypothetical protein